MAIKGIGNTFYSLKLGQENHVYEVVVKDPITLTRSKNSPSKLTCDIYRDPDISPEVGDILALTVDGMHNCFFGYITTTTHNREWSTIEAYDQLYYLNRNKTYLVYHDKKASDVLIDIAKFNGFDMLDPPMVEDTEYIIPTRVEDNVSFLEIITTALDLTKKNIGKTFYLWDDYGSLTLTSDMTLCQESRSFITLGYIEGYEWKVTLEDRYTQAHVEKRKKKEEVPVPEEGEEVDPEEPEVPVEPEEPVDPNYSEYETEEGDVVEQTFKNYDELINKYGILRYDYTAQEEENVSEVAEHLIDDMLAPGRELSLSGVQGDITVRGGTPVLVDFFTRDRREFLRGWLSVDEVTHTISNCHHTMDLSGTFVQELNEWDNTDPEYFSAPDVMY